jgi:hypothetical protein
VATDGSVVGYEGIGMLEIGMVKSRRWWGPNNGRLFIWSKEEAMRNRTKPDEMIESEEDESGSFGA